MAVKLLLVFTCFSLACCLVWAGPSKVVVRSEEGRWIAEIVGAASDGWPEIVSRKSFATKEQALAQQLVWQQHPQLEIQSAVSFEPQVAKGVLWPTTQSWSEEWEHKYAKWIEDEVDSEFFVRYNVATDCADVAYSLRWIFARIHGLPAAALLGGANTLLTNEALRSNWASLPTSANWYQDRRFLAALNYLLDLTYTHTLWGDSFPVALNKNALLSGSYHLSLGEQSGHTQLIHWLGSQSGVPFLALNSTVPRKVRPLMESMLSAGPAKDKKGAILRFRWAVKTSSGITLKKAVEMPGYSTEQYSFEPKDDYAIALFEKLGYTGGREGIRDYLYKDVLTQFKARVELVKEAQKHCQNGACKPGTPEWEEWSTPSRDSRIKAKIGSLRVVGGVGNHPSLAEPIVTLEGVPWTFGSMLYNWKHEEYSSDPQLSETERWGAGGSGWAQRHVLFLQNKIQERKEVLRKGALTCAGKNCQFGTELWKKTSSNDIDTVLSKKVKYLANNDGAIPSEALQYLDAVKNTPLATVAGQGITVDHVLATLAGMNSSALASENEQWGLGEWTVLSTVGNSTPTIIDNKWMLEPGTFEIAVWDLATGKRVNLPFKPLRIVADGILLIKNAQGYSLFDIRTQQMHSVPMELQGLELSKMVAYDNHLVVMFADRLMSWKLDMPTVTLILESEAAGTKWRHRARDLFISEQGMYDVTYRRFYPEHKDPQLSCVGKKYVMFQSEGPLVMNRQTGLSKSLGVTALTSLECEVAKFTEVVGGSSSTVLYRWNENLDKEVEAEFKGQCYLYGPERISCQDARVYIFKDGQWQKEEQPESVYTIRGGENAAYEVVEKKTGKVVLKGLQVTVFQDRYASVVLSAGEFAHVVDLKNPQIPLLTNMFKAGWGVGRAQAGPFHILTGYDESAYSSVLWRPRN